MSSPRDNPFTKDPGDVPVTALNAPEVQVLNAVTKLLREQRRFDRETVTKFKKLFGDSNLQVWIILAGVGGLVELVRLGLDLYWRYHP
jgi:hypothetical protein